MKKRFLTVLLVLVLLLGLSVCVFAESQLWHITDDAGILSSDENTELETYAQSVSETYGVGIYIVTVDDYNDYYDDPYETAWQIYHEYTLGEGDDRDGVILLLSMDNRKFATFFYGPQAEYAFDAYGQELLESYFLDDFRADDWANGCQHFISGCEYFLSQAASGSPVRKDDYDYSSDGDSSGSPFLFVSWRIIGWIAFSSMFFALIVCVLLKSKMKSVRKATAANAYVSGDLNLTASHDQYTHTTETRTKIEHESSGDSHAESGGGGSGRSGSF